MQHELIKELSAFGAVENEVRLLGEDSPLLIEYLDFLSAKKPSRNADRKPTLCPDAVLEIEGRPGLYVLSANHLVGDIATQREQLLQVRRAIACRGDTAPLAVIQHGQITIFASDLKTELPLPLTVRSDEPRAPWFIRDILMGAELTSGNVDLFGNAIRGHSDSEAIYDLLFRLLTEVNSSLLRTAPLKGKLDDVLSLVGRALFTRFLIDRGIINRKTFPSAYKGSGPEECFTDAKAASETCLWLEENFNGELLPLPAKKSEFAHYFRSLDTSDHIIFKTLSKILYRTTESGQLHLDWGFIDFAHVPVGLLSQVYERYAHEHFEKHAKDESVHYTPHHIASYVVKQAFEGITTTPRDKVRVLDPAAGAGIFLVLGFRRLIAERWAATGRRPDKKEIRKILYEQIRGFDINEHALRLAALSLYLTALEMDPDPFPPSSLKFEKLQGMVLIPTRQKGEEFPAYPVLGSLGPMIGEEHNNRYEIVLGNPPWTAWVGKDSDKINSTVQEMIRKIAGRRNTNGLLEEISKDYQHPDKVPDLPFVWRAMEWAKKDGVLAFVLHGRLLFKRSDVGANARSALFRGIRVTGILNGTGLDATTVWPGINQPFCLLFAKNRPATTFDTFYFISPDREKQLNSKNIIRVDYQSAQPIEWSVLEQQPHLLKTLFRGTALDAELITRLQSMTIADSDDKPATCIRLADYWVPENNLCCGFGYQVAGRGQNADELRALHGVKLDTEDDLGLFINTQTLPAFDYTHLHRPRDPDIYRSPLVIIKAAPGRGHGIVRARLALDPTPVIYSESFIGYSAHKHPEGKALSSYLFLLANSDLYLYYTLLTSAKFGVERRVLQGVDVADFPIVRFDVLSESQKAEAVSLSRAFSSGKVSIADVNEWVSDIYQLEPSDNEVIRDTLETQMPFQSAHERADSVPTKDEVDRYINRLKSALAPFFEITGELVDVQRSSSSPDSWIFLDIKIDSNTAITSGKIDVSNIVRLLADNAGSSRVFVKHGIGHLSVGIIAKYRYWTESRARLCAMDILRDYSQVFPIAE